MNFASRTLSLERYFITLDINDLISQSITGDTRRLVTIIRNMFYKYLQGTRVTEFQSSNLGKECHSLTKERPNVVCAFLLLEAESKSHP